MDRQQFISLLESVSPGLARKVIVEQSDTFIFQDGQVSTYNGEICVRAPLPEDLKFLEGAIPGKELYDLLRSLPADELDIKETKKELKISGGSKKKFSAGIKRHTVEVVIDVPQPKKWEELPEKFTQAVSACLFSVSSDMTRPLLTCVHVAPDYAESCDDYRATRVPLEGGPNPNLLIPGRYAQYLVDYSVTALARSRGWLHFKTGDGVVFSCRTYEGDYPNISSVVCAEGSPVTIPQKGVLDLLLSANVFARGDHKLDDTVRLTFDSGVLYVRGQSASGWFEGSHKVRYKGDPIAAEINPHMLVDILERSSKARICPRAIVFENDQFVHAVQIYSVDGQE